MLAATAFAADPEAPKKVLTDEEEAVKQGVKAPTEWVFPQQQPLRVLTVHGFWYKHYAVERALARMGGVFIDNSWEYVDSGLRYYPESYEGLMGHHLVVIANVNAEAFGPVRRKMLKDYVAQGGAILFLGGWYAYGPGYHNSVFEEISPVTYPEKRNAPPNESSPGVWTGTPPDGLPLAPGKDIVGAGFAKLNWAASPRVFWYHPLTPKAGAKVLLTADGKPLLITGTYGKGRVAVFAGTVMGDPPAGKLPFWQWDGWPTILADTMNWLVAGTAKPASALSTEARTALSTELLGIGVKKADKLAPVITRYARLCGDKDTAKLLLEGVATLEGDAPQALVDLVGDATRPYIDATFAQAAQSLLDTGQTNKASLGLRVLGRTKTPGAKAALEQALKTGEVDVPENPLDNEESGQQIEDPLYTRYVIRLGALEGLAHLGDPAEVPQLRTYLRQYARTISKIDNLDVYLVSQDDELYQQTALAAMRCGDAEAAGPAIDALLGNLYIIARQTRMLDYAPDEFEVGYKIQQAAIRKQYDRIFARQRQLYWQLASLPPAVLPALAKRIAAEQDPLIIPIAFAAFGKGFGKGAQPLPADASAALKTSKIPAVAELGN
ncbi:MAG: glutamine amidotransferase [Armatimonadota bacterium]